MEKYKHIVQYYETDKMGITHHSNYIRFMEEARVKFLDDIGLSYKELESAGFSSPVISLDCQFKKSTTNADEILIETSVLEISPAKLTIGYTMTCNGEIVCISKSSHCFLGSNGKPVAIKKVSEKLYEKLISLSEK